MPPSQILVIDDEESLVKAIERALRTEYRVAVAYSGTQGLKVARRINPDLIILDVVMPGMDGFDTCNELRNDPILKSTPILFLSALSNIESKITGFEVGADDYLVKPFNLKELRLRIRAILRRNLPREALPAEPILRHSDIILNYQTFTVTTQNGLHRLTPIEFDLLYYFMTHSGQVFSSMRLLQDIWDYPSDTGSPDLVRMHIRNLRRKIEPDPRQPIYIKTIPRHGYILPIIHE